MHIRGLWVALAILGAVPGTAAADADTDKADALFKEGRALFDTDLPAACAKFQESLKYNSQAIGTLLNVALCDEKQGRIASAVARFTEARDRAKEGNMPEQLAAAQEHLDALAARVPHLSIILAEELPDTKVVIDDKLVKLSAIANLPVDPGERLVEVSAPGRLPYQTKVTVTAGAPPVDVRIPPLEKSMTVNVKSSRRTIGKITAIAGVVAIGTSIGLGLYANHAYQAEFDGTPPNCNKVDGKRLCNPDGYAATKNALLIGNVGTVVGVVGLAAAGVGAYLWLRSPSEHAARAVSVVPQLGPEGAGLAAVGTF